MPDPDDDLEAELDLEDNPLDDPAGEPEPDEGQDSLGADELAARDEPSPEDRQTRANTRIRQLAEEKRRAEADAAAVRQRLAELERSFSAQQQQRQETDAERAARYDAMSPGEAILASQRESEQRIAARMNQVQFTQYDKADRDAYEAKAARFRVYAAYKDKVEARLQELRNQGINADRMVLFKYLYGEDQAALVEKGNGGQRGATPRLQQRRVRVGDSGSDISPQREQQRGSRGNDAAARERRLANVLI